MSELSKLRGTEIAKIIVDEFMSDESKRFFNDDYIGESYGVFDINEFLYNGNLTDYLESLENDNYKLEYVDSYGGEDCGSEYWRVYKLTNKETNECIHLQWSGDYSSWSGTEWDENGPFIVKSRETIKLVWDKV